MHATLPRNGWCESLSSINTYSQNGIGILLLFNCFRPAANSEPVSCSIKKKKIKKKIGIIIDGDKYVKHLVNIQRTVVE